MPKSTSDCPSHVAIIPDGNRRWAKCKGWDLTKAYKRGAKVLDECLTYLADRGVGYITVWPASPSNFTRDMAEIAALLEAFEEYVALARKSYPDRDFRAHTIGRLDRLATLAPELLSAIEKLKAETRNGRRTNIVLAFDYGGRDEIARAFARMLKHGVKREDVSTDKINEHLDTAGMPDPDLIVRTGGDRRLSGFLLFQAEYAEIHFTDTLLPDFGPREVSHILEQYAGRRYSQ